MAPTRLATVSAMIALLAYVAAHGDEHAEMGNMDMSKDNSTFISYEGQYELDNYFSLSAHTGMIITHILLMVLAWVFILPLGVVFSIGRSKLALPAQLVFLLINALGLVMGTIYNVSTPDLYEKNAHHSIGWIATWIMTAQAIMSLLFVYAGRSSRPTIKSSERAAFLPASLHGLGGPLQRPYHIHRWSGDSGQGTEPPSPRNHSREFESIGADIDYDTAKPEMDHSDEEDPELSEAGRPRYMRNNFFDKYLSTHLQKMNSSKLRKIIEVVYEIIDRTILVLAFVALVTGIITYSGIFRSQNVFSGLAHFIKGGIFFWYGLLTLGRWMGCFADLGWAWNVKPTRSEVGRWKSKLPSAEFTESFVIWLYGASNVFLEHLASWGGAWSAQDFEHVSISIMFFGGGLCGMLVESKTIRKWLNAPVDQMPTRTEAHPSEAQEIRTPPRSYSTSLNVIPALVILLLGIMMSSHHQETMISTMVHKQWGTMLCGFSIARGFTYIIMWLSPPTSIYPSRPPTELVASFCLISGGMIFMASAKDIMYYAHAYDLMAMFLFTVTMGLTAFIMAYEILVLSLKGWAVRREHRETVRF